MNEADLAFAIYSTVLVEIVNAANAYGPYELNITGFNLKDIEFPTL